MLQALKDKEEEKEKKEQDKIEKKRLREEKKKEKEAAKMDGTETGQKGRKRKAKKAKAEDFEDEENELPTEHDEGDEEAHIDGAEGSDDGEESGEYESDELDENAEESFEGIKYMEDCWKGLDGNVDDSDIVGKWFACIYYHGDGANKTPVLYIGRCTQRLFAIETNKPICLRLNCLKRQYGTDTKLEENEAGDEDNFGLLNVIAGPIKLYLLPRR